jgi:hypothetical protein
MREASHKSFLFRHAFLKDREVLPPLCYIPHDIRSKMTPNYRTMVERYPNLKEEVGGSISRM